LGRHFSDLICFSHSSVALPGRRGPGKERRMSTVRDILAQKGSQVLSIGKVATVLEAALVMNEHKVGALVVIEDGCVAGMFTERDVLRRVGGGRRGPVGTLGAG